MKRAELRQRLHSEFGINKLAAAVTAALKKLGLDAKADYSEEDLRAVAEYFGADTSNVKAGTVAPVSPEQAEGGVLAVLQHKMAGIHRISQVIENAEDAVVEHIATQVEQFEPNVMDKLAKRLGVSSSRVGDDLAETIEMSMLPQTTSLRRLPVGHVIAPH